MRFYGQPQTIPHTTHRPLPPPPAGKQPPKATALGGQYIPKLTPPGGTTTRARHSTRQPAPSEARTCENCGTTFTRRDGERLNTFNERRGCTKECSIALRVAAQKKAAAEQPPCHCGKPYYAKGLCSTHYKQTTRKDAA